ncbi:MAG: RagB/SusD family nutrient uptake outer membrane protein [Tannerella sp.]|jgi:tetratricopeptide (TPR) repeat protein|nr:RagB/SusD family nutrient uptake outer membrane protein [Tannerella sp.]
MENLIIKKISNRIYLRNIRLVLGLATVLSLSSCEEFLDLKPTGSIVADNAISDAKTARAAVIGGYSQLRSVYQSSINILGTMPADNVLFGASLTQYTQLDGNAYSTNNSVSLSAYRGLYSLINRANWVIADIGKVNDPALQEVEKKQLLGEAYFLRAYGYFDLARGWGGMQIQLAPTTDLNAITGITRSSLAETYAQAVSDLRQAETLLPEDNATTRNRAQKAAARALLARVYLYAGEWEQAETAASDVIVLDSKFDPVTPFNAYFTPPFLSRESVLELSYSASDQNNSWSGWYCHPRGTYEYQPTAEIIALLLDPQKAGARSSLIATAANGEIYNAQFSAGGLDPLYLIRIAELYLIRAEARVRKAVPDLPGAVADLNVVRHRADVTDYTGASTVDDLLQAIEDERRIEFAFEPHRWYDLVRTGRAGEVLGAERQYWLFPLPEADVFADPDLGGENNPGY